MNSPTLLFQAIYSNKAIAPKSGKGRQQQRRIDQVESHVHNDPAVARIAPSRHPREGYFPAFSDPSSLPFLPRPNLATVNTYLPTLSRASAETGKPPAPPPQNPIARSIPVQTSTAGQSDSRLSVSSSCRRALWGNSNRGWSEEDVELGRARSLVLRMMYVASLAVVGGRGVRRLLFSFSFFFSSSPLCI